MATAQQASASASANDFNVAIPQDELNERPSLLLANGWYSTTFGGGAELVDNNKGWRGIRIPLSGFASRDGKLFERERRYQVTVETDSDQARAIGRKQLVEVAVAFGIAEETTVNGKPAKRVTATSPEEFVEQLNALAGSPVDAYVTTKKRKRDGEVVMRDDGNGPVMDNEISRLAPFGEGK